MSALLPCNKLDFYSCRQNKGLLHLLHLVHMTLADCPDQAFRGLVKLLKYQSILIPANLVSGGAIHLGGINCRGADSIMTLAKG